MEAIGLIFGTRRLAVVALVLLDLLSFFPAVDKLDVNSMFALLL
jgi:hypothetical protein